MSATLAAASDDGDPLSSMKSLPHSHISAVCQLHFNSTSPLRMWIRVHRSTWTCMEMHKKPKINIWRSAYLMPSAKSMPFPKLHRHLE